MNRPISVLALLAVALVAGPRAQAGAPALRTLQRGVDDSALIQKARAIHDRVIALDTHADINPNNFTRARNYTQRLETQVNLPKMVEGGLDAAFFIVYVGQGPLTAEGYADAYKQAVAKFEAVHHLTKEIAPEQIELALTAADVARIAKSGKKVALIGIENAYPLGTDIKRVKEFHDRGGRYISLAHNGHSQFADSNTGERDGKWLHNGLSELGKQVIAEANKWGLMIDLSHPSKAANLQALALTKAPVIASHSAARALADHSRNMDDEQLLALKKNGGVIQTVAFASYVKIQKPDSPERAAAILALRKELGLPAPGQGGGPAAGGGRGGGAMNRLTPEQRAKYDARMAEIDKQFPGDPRATVADFVNHIDYLVKKIGIDHVGISSDFDGGGGVTGWNGAEETFNVTLELVRRGYTEEQIGKLWSGNLLRVMAEVEKVAKQLQGK
ncbi:MAG TPA: dipeptidase [Vicinamibacterales bacterium]|nr:dipeptidase [Vicinamibacterales bacterium]